MKVDSIITKLRSRMFVMMLLFGGNVTVHARYERLRLLHHRRISSPCKLSTDCVENAFCAPDKQACFCLKGFVPEKNRTHVSCLRVAQNVGDSCTENVQCRVSFGDEAECRENVCQCSEGAAFKKGRCYRLVGLGKRCQTSLNCYVKDSPSFCVYGHCSCALMQHPNFDNSACLNDTRLGDSCTVDEECVDEHSRCSKFCVCNVNYVTSHDGERCIEAANVIGDACKENEQCQEYLPNSHCRNETCACLKSFHRRGKLCIKNVALNDVCKSHEECVTPSNIDSDSTEVRNVGCYDGVCSCASGYIFTEKFCDCIRYSEINAGIARCITNLHIFLVVLHIVTSLKISCI